MRMLVQDVQYGFRRLLRSPGFAAVAVLTLALGIGATTAVFSLRAALFVRMLPFPKADELVALHATHSQRPWITSVGREDFEDWQGQTTAFAHLAYTSSAVVNLTGQSFPGFGEPEQLLGAEISAGFFPLLGVPPQLGRWLLSADQARGSAHVIVLSYGLWQRRFGGRADIVGQSLMLDGRSFTVVGVMPRTFRFNQGYRCEFWVPLQHFSSGRLSHQYAAYGRLKPGMPLETAQAQLTLVAEQLARAYPETNAGWGVRVVPLRRMLRGEFGPAFSLFSAAVAMVLLIGCANVANLLLARGATRTRELAVRRALGAGRLPIVRLLLAEGLLLGGAAAVLGTLFAAWAIRLAAAAAPAWLELSSILYLDATVLAFAVVLSLLSSGAAALWPALRGARVDVSESLRRGGSGMSIGQRDTRSLSALVIGEVALAVLLLVSAGLLIKSYQRVLAVDLGFHTEKVLVARMELSRSGYPGAAQRAAFVDHLLQRVRQLPAVQAAAMTDALPLGDVLYGDTLEIAGQPLPEDRQLRSLAFRSVTPGLFSALGMRRLGGRDFDRQDDRESEPVAIINQAAALRFFAGENPIGKRVRQLSATAWCTIVGVVGDVRHTGPEQPAALAVYRPFSQSPTPFVFLAVQTTAEPQIVGPAIRAEIRRLDAGLPLAYLRPMADLLGEKLTIRRHIMLLLSLFGIFGLLLAGIGLAGVMAYSVAQRTQEIGVRMALGANPGTVLRMVLRRGLLLTACGACIGLITSLALTPLLQSQLYAVQPTDPGILLAVAAALGAASLLACYAPARRAAKTDPIAALRGE